jgi:hypothetical protein
MEDRITSNMPPQEPRRSKPNFTISSFRRNGLLAPSRTAEISTLGWVERAESGLHRTGPDALVLIDFEKQRRSKSSDSSMRRSKSSGTT